jgi:hypothetical protein
VGAWRIRWLQTETGGAHDFIQVWPILLVCSCIVGICEVVTMVRRWDLAMVERDGMAGLCVGSMRGIYARSAVYARLAYASSDL